MKWLNINVPLGVSETPIGFSRCKNVAGLSLIGSLFGTVGDYAAAVNTAQQNRWANEETNESNERINQEQLAWARENYELEKEENRFLVDQAYKRELENREYNSPLNEMRRLRAAGLNPYLAKYGNGAAGGSGSISALVGSPARHNQPNMIPMQASHEQAFTGFGEGITDALRTYYMSKESERADYALAADITFRDRKAIQDSLNYLLEMKKEGTNKNWINSQINHLLRADQLEQDKLSHQREVDSFNSKMEEYNSETQRLSVQIQHMLARSNIAVNSEQINLLAANAALARIEASEMHANGVSQRKINEYIAGREKESMDIIRRQNEREKRQNSGVARQAYIDFTDWLFTPLKGLVSIGIK